MAELIIISKLLYKKTHRQYLREFKVGRKFRFYGFYKEVNTYEITRGPRLWRNREIIVNVDDAPGVCTIYRSSGKTRYSKDDIVWLD